VRRLMERQYSSLLGYYNEEVRLKLIGFIIPNS